MMQANSMAVSQGHVSPWAVAHVALTSAGYKDPILYHEEIVQGIVLNEVSPGVILMGKTLNSFQVQGEKKE